MSDFSQWDEARRGEQNILWSNTTSPSPPYQLHTHTARRDEDKRPTKTVTLWHQKEHIAMYTCSCWTAAYCLQRHTLLCLVKSRPPKRDIAQTHWQPQNSLWLIQALQGPEQANWCRASSGWQQRSKLGKRSMLVLNTPTWKYDYKIKPPVALVWHQFCPTNPKHSNYIFGQNSALTFSQSLS